MNLNQGPLDVALQQRRFARDFPGELREGAFDLAFTPLERQTAGVWGKVRVALAVMIAAPVAALICWTFVVDLMR